jgi:hypothetical protein
MIVIEFRNTHSLLMLELLTTLRAPASPAQSVLGGGTEERAEGARRRSAGESEGR